MDDRPVTRPITSRRAASRADAAAAGLLALLLAAPVGILAGGGGGLPTPGSLNDPARALAAIGASPDLTIVAATILAAGVLQLVVVIAVDERLAGWAPRWRRLAVAFGVASAGFLMLDGALGVTALPQLAHLDARQAAVDGAYLATLGVRNGIDRVIPLTLGLWALAVHAPAWRLGGLPRPLVVVGLVLGAAGVAGAAVPAAGTASVLVAIVWSVAFAVVALRERVVRSRRGNCAIDRAGAASARRGSQPVRPGWRSAGDVSERHQQGHQRRG